eukprot:4957072-Karenia_brevis.AAC.1
MPVRRVIFDRLGHLLISLGLKSRFGAGPAPEACTEAYGFVRVGRPGTTARNTISQPLSPLTLGKRDHTTPRDLALTSPMPCRTVPGLTTWKDREPDQKPPSPNWSPTELLVWYWGPNWRLVFRTFRGVPCKVFRPPNLWASRS